MEGTPTLHQTLVALGSVLVGLAAGWAGRWLFGRLEQRAQRTPWAGDEALYAALGETSLAGFAVTGVWAAALALPLRDHVRSIVDASLLSLIILLITVVCARLTAGLIRAYTRQRPGVAGSSSIFVNITRLLVFAIGLLVLLQTLGVSIAPLLTALGVGGLAVALALQDTLSNLFAGLHILASKKVQPGDYIQLDSGQEGYVVDINWRNTWIRALPNNMVLVPNARLAQAIVTNFYQPEREMSVLIEVGVAYGSDLEQVERVTIEVAREVMRGVSGGVPSSDPFIRYHTFNESSIDFSVILRAKEYTDQYVIKHEFVKQLHDRYLDEGITIPFPIRTIGFVEPGRDGADPHRNVAASSGRSGTPEEGADGGRSGS
ncbi:MAG TPA: mechanosensitive ion channel family protein [Actinomycetota bacterium]|nr:mechanosensitive ion channel family protein [Actinomycetota bacterium]